MINKVQKGQTPTLLDTDKANELIGKINALLNMTVERTGDIDKFEVSGTNSVLTLSQHTAPGSGGSTLDGWEELEDVYFCVNGRAELRNILVKQVVTYNYDPPT